MSSILDALRKLEQEKAVREQPAHGSVRDVNLERDIDLTPKVGERRSSTGMAVMIVVGVLVIAGITAGVSTVVVMMSRHPEQSTAVALNNALPQPAPTAAVPQTAPSPIAVPAPLPNATQPPAEAITIVKPVQVAQAAPKTDIAPAPKPKPEPKTEKPAAAQSDDMSSATVPAAPKAPVEDKKPATPLEKVPLEKLPLLTESERVRLGLPPIKINIVGLPNSRNSRASALINMQKVYVGENIPDTDARLIDVDLHGVGLEIRGKRYYFSKN